MSTALGILIGAGGTVAALLTVLLPVIRAQGSNLRRDLDTLRGDLRADVASLRADVGEVRRNLHALSDRVARIEGAMTGPWRPANGTPAPATFREPPATEECPCSRHGGCRTVAWPGCAHRAAVRTRPGAAVVHAGRDPDRR